MGQYECVLTVGGYVYGCLAVLGSKGEKEKEEGEEAWGALPPTATLLSLRVRHCSVSHQSPTCSHTSTVKYVQRGVSHKHTLAEQARASVSFQNARLCLVRLCSLLSALFFKSSPHPPAGLLCQRLKKKRKGGKTKGGAEKGHVSEWRKFTQCHVVRPQQRCRQEHNTPIKIWPSRILTKSNNNAYQWTCSCKRNSIWLITQPVAHMEGPVHWTDG